MIPPVSLVYANTRVRWVCGGYFSFTGIVFVYWTFHPGKGGVGLQILAGLMAAATLAFAIRSLIGYSIKASPDGVRIRSAVRTRRYKWSEIRQFHSVQGQVGTMAYNRKILAIELTTGQQVRFVDLNDSPKGMGWVDDAARTLNMYVPKSTESPPTN